MISGPRISDGNKLAAFYTNKQIFSYFFAHCCAILEILDNWRRGSADGGGRGGNALDPTAIRWDFYCRTPVKLRIWPFELIEQLSGRDSVGSFVYWPAAGPQFLGKRQWVTHDALPG